ncbi:MAG: hypothetical protein QF643_01885 [Flavobacteriaceae bacterium]|jgi:hypothetical protein|nr:hypothetical protein [Flavobacteriaceae bacterium]
MKKLLSIFFVALMFFPNALEISHILADENHKIECKNTKVHIHEDRMDCNLITFLTSNSYLGYQNTSELITLDLLYNTSYALSSQPITSKYLSFSLRAPPSVI